MCESVYYSRAVLSDVDSAAYLLHQDEMLARFVVNSHVKHHPNKATDEEDMEEVSCPLRFPA